MASNDNTNGDVTTSSSATDGSMFNLQVVSPSIGVTSPLRFSDLPTTTTVKELKDKVRNLVDSKPEDEAQRLIHRGRLLSRPEQTMREIFGDETLRSLDSQTLHLVLKPSTTSTDPPPNTSLPQNTQGPPPGLIPGTNIAIPQMIQTGIPVHPPAVGVPMVTVHQQQFHVPNGQQFHIPNGQQLHIPNGQQFQVTNGQPVQSATQQHPVVQQPAVPTMQRLQELQQEGQRFHQELLAQQQLWRERMATTAPSHPPPIVNVNHPVVMPHLMVPPPVNGMLGFQDIVGQMQRDRAATGNNGVQNNGPSQPHQNNGLSQPVAHMPVAMNGTTSPWVRTSRREGVGPNGERWHITVNETVTNIANAGQLPIPNQVPPPGYAVQQGAQVLGAIARGDQQQARQRYQDFAQAHPSQNPGSTVTNQSGTSDDVSATPIPPSTSNTSSQSATPQITSADSASGVTTVSPMVYLVSSPAGPRALLINGADQFFTPQQPSQFMQQQAINLQSLRARQQARAERHAARRAAALNGPANAANPAPADAPANAVNGDANNNMMVQMLPHVWLLIRLAGFVWFLVSGDSSWYRWIAVVSLAVVVFLINTGLFNGAAEQVWGPIRRHLENLLPLAAPDRPAAPADGAALLNADIPAGQQAPANLGSTATNSAPANLRHGELDPSQVAARLIEQRRQHQETWLWTQLRRAEHAMILFLASLIPGVGERHILARAAEENQAAEAERQRREAAAEPTVAAAATSAATTNDADIGASTIATATTNAEANSSSSSSGTRSGDDATDGRNDEDSSGPAGHPASAGVGKTSSGTGNGTASASR